MKSSPAPLGASTQPTLSAALLAETQKRWQDSYALCQQILEIAPNDPDALNLLGRIFREWGDGATAIGLQCLVLRLAPHHRRAADDLAIARAAIPSAEAAVSLYEAAKALEPDIANHHRSLGSTQPFVGIDRVEGLVRAALNLDASNAKAHAALGNILTRRGNRTAAMTAYGLAIMLDWSYADVHLALAEFYEAANDGGNASKHFYEAFSRKVLYPTHAPYAVRRVLVLKAPSGYPANAILDFCIDFNRNDLNVLYITKSVTVLPEAPATDVIFSAIGETEENEDTINRCIALLASTDKPVLNHPIHLKKVRRSELYTTLRNVAGCIALKTLRLSRDCAMQGVSDQSQVGGMEFPLLIRPIDTHRGDGMELVHTSNDVRDYVERFPALTFNITPFVDYRSADGYYRKYRVIVIAGKPFAYHLAISENWLVHYWRVSGLMREHAWMREEEERFLSAPGSVFPDWDATFRDMAAAIGLDYFGVDCAVSEDGSVLVFECDPCAFVHCREALDDVFAYKYDYVPRIFSALDDLMDDRADRYIRRSLT